MSITIKSITSNNPLFKSAEFPELFNVVLAERTKESTIKDSRNGLGKSTLIEIIHFCLGSNTNKRLKLYLKDWEFNLRILLQEKDILVSRSFDSPSIISIEGDTTGWPIQPQRERERFVLTAKEWNLVLGNLMFGLPIATPRKYSPTFRSLISYFIRRGRDAFSKAFEHHRKQREWEKQINNCFLLNLAWEDASDWQILKDKKKLLQDLKKASEAGVVTEMIGSLGELQAAKVRLENQIQTRASELNNYQVHPQYQELQRRADNLTSQIHRNTNLNISDDNLLSFYLESIESEVNSTSEDILGIYESLQIQIPEIIQRRLEDAQNFHAQIINNRRDFLASEIERLRKVIDDRQKQIESLASERSEIMQTLNTHGALEEYTKLQQLHLKDVEALNEINTRIETLRKIEDAKIEYRLESDLLTQRARRDYMERQTQREKAISIFNENSEALYSAPGSLVIDINDNGFKFDVEIERSDSEGVSSMKIFCYDLMLAQLWSEYSPSPKILIHDSTIFEGVDERQVALALELAFRKSREFGFQYICMLNSDRLPDDDFSEGFDINSYARLTLTDATEDGGLLGFRF